MHAFCSSVSSYTDLARRALAEIRADDLDHKELLELNPEGGVIRFAEQRALLVDAVATGGRALRGKLGDLSMKFDELPTLLTPEKLPYLSGVERLADGTLHVAVLTRMPEVSPRMIAWWFGEYMQTTEHYKRWHPRDHIWMSWENKRPGTQVGAKHLVHEYIGGRLNKLCITFVPPEDFFADGLTRMPKAVAVCGRPGLLERPIDLGRMVHLALPRPWGCELHSRFWLGHIASRNGSRLPEAIGNAPWVRHMLARMSFGRALAVHCHEEMSTLAGFLPDLYASES